MIRDRGGLANTGFEGFVKALTLQFAPPDCIPLSLCFQQPSYYQPNEYFDPSDVFFYDTRAVLAGVPMPPSSYPGMELSAGIQRLPHGFRCLINKAVLSVNTIRLLCRIEQARTTYASSPEWGREQPSSFGAWQPAEHSDFWECCPSISRTSPDLEKYLCLALLLYTANEFAPERTFHKGMALYSGPRTVLAAEIGMLDRVRLSPTQRKCWMWIWWVLIDSWTEHNSLTDVGSLLTSQFWAVFPEVSDSASLRWVLEPFFWGGNFESVVQRLVGDEYNADVAASVK